MKRILTVALLAGSIPTTVQAVDACGTIICLSHGIGALLGACVPYRAAYYAIDYKKPLKTITERLKFLNTCSLVTGSLVLGGTSSGGTISDADLASLKYVIVHGAGWCDPHYLAAQLNKSLDPDDGEYGFVSGGISEIPEACQAYADHTLTFGITLPVKTEIGCKLEWQEGPFGWANVSVCQYEWIVPPIKSPEEFLAEAQAEAERLLAEMGIE